LIRVRSVVRLYSGPPGSGVRHRAFGIGRSASGVRHRAFGVRQSGFADCLLPSADCRVQGP
ncbi:hypothetical protein E4O86_22945, partial [Rhizobiales bacterium L72]|nr:hypothetical protein [Propylenella binzhouense]